MGIFSKRGWMDWRRMVHKNRDLQRKIELIRVEKEELERRILALQTGGIIQEKMVREVLGYVRENETVIQFE
jgi:cell division protein FtsB